MSKGPDLSAFPIPRKGGARPISMDDLADTSSAAPERAGEEDGTRPAQRAVRLAPEPQARPTPGGDAPGRNRAPAAAAQPTSPTVSGQVVATTVKLDEGRYLRLVNAGQPGPGRLKRRSIQEMMVEAIDEWFDRRGL